MDSDLLLCKKCNTEKSVSCFHKALGLFKDNPDLLNKAVQYLKEFK